MDIEYLKRFVAIGEFLNFRKASEALFVSQPALSHSIAALEKEIGTPVFIRNTKNVALTKEGEILYAAAKKILDEYDVALADISKVTAFNDNTLKIGYVGAALDNSLTPLLRVFRRNEPNIDVNLTRHYGTEIRSLIENHTIQFAVSYKEYIDGIPGVKYEVLDNEEFTLLVNSDNPLADSIEVNIEEISKLPLIICERDSAPYYYDKIMEIFAQIGAVPNVVQKVRLISDIYRLVDMGVGSAIMSYSPRRQIYNSFDLSFVAINSPDPEVVIHKKTLAWCGELSQAGRKFVKEAKNYYNIK